MRLSAALIVKDEADHLRRCLASIRPVVDEIVVVDTGSSDESVEVARSFGALVLHRPWDGSFAAPRNLGLEHVTGDWVLYIDADEHLAPTTRAHVEAELEDPLRRVVAKRVRLRTRHGFTPLLEYRLWRSRPDVRFEGVVHETHVQALHRIAQAEGLEIGEADLQIEHEGYEGDLTRKHHRNIPLLETQIGADPNRPYLWAELGRAREGLGDADGARAAWAAGIEVVRRNGPRVSVDCLVYSDLIMAEAGRGVPAEDLVAEADLAFPDNAVILWAGLLDAVARADHQAVIDRVDRLLDHTPEDLARAALGVDERVLGHWSIHARGMARFQLGDAAGAARDFAAAEALAPAISEYRVKRRLAESRAGTVPSAEAPAR